MWWKCFEYNFGTIFINTWIFTNIKKDDNKLYNFKKSTLRPQMQWNECEESHPFSLSFVNIFHEFWWCCGKYRRHSHNCLIWRCRVHTCTNSWLILWHRNPFQCCIVADSYIALNLITNSSLTFQIHEYGAQFETFKLHLPSTFLILLWIAVTIKSNFCHAYQKKDRRSHATVTFISVASLNCL